MFSAPVTRRRTLLAAAAGVAAAPFALGQAAHAAVPRIYLDPGHGGTDPGSAGNGLQEKTLTLNIALQTRDYLKANWNVDVRMSRTTDVTRSLSYRTGDANAWGANIFVSIHINAGGGTGFESYRYPSAGSTTIRLHNAVHSRVLSGMRTIAAVTDRGQKTATFYVLRQTAMPAVLTETCSSTEWPTPICSSAPTSSPPRPGATPAASPTSSGSNPKKWGHRGEGTDLLHPPAGPRRMRHPHTTHHLGLTDI